jgi:hypothetical protein
MSTTLPEGQLLIQKALLGYPKLYEAKIVNNDPNGRPRYGCQIYLPKSDESTKAKIDKEVQRITKLHLKGVKPKAKDLCIKDGDDDDNRDEHARGHWIISANRAESQGRPQVVDRKRNAIDSKDAGDVYAGCVCNFLISLFVPKRGNTNQISASLEIVQKVADSDPFGSPRVVAEDVMPELDEEEFEA